MLAVFDRTVAKCPEGLWRPEVEEGTKGGSLAALLDQFSLVHEEAVTVRLGSSSFMTFATDKQNPFLPRLFASVDDIFCIFQGALGNIPLLKQQYGLGKTATEDIIVIEAYRSLRDRGPCPIDKVVRDLSGKFAFVLFDSSSNFIFIAADADGAVPFFWGTDSENHLIVSDDVEIMKKHCGKHFVQFPKACESLDLLMIRIGISFKVTQWTTCCAAEDRYPAYLKQCKEDLSFNSMPESIRTAVESRE